jgi:hypothetical protein
MAPNVVLAVSNPANDSINNLAEQVANVKIGQANKFDGISLPIDIALNDTEAYEEDAFRRLRRRETGADLKGKDGWKLAGEKKGAKVYQGFVEGTTWGTLKTVGTVDCSADKLAEILWENDNVPKYDDMTSYVKTIEKLGERSEFRHNMCKGVTGIISKRDFVVVSTRHRDEKTGIHYVATRSFDLPEHPEISGVVRAKVLISGFIIRPHPDDENKCEMVTIMHFDLGGSVPAIAVNYLGKSAPLATVIRIRKVVAEILGETKRASWW